MGYISLIINTKNLDIIENLNHFMRKKYIQWIFTVTVLLVLLIGAVILALCVGEQSFSLSEIVNIYRNPDGVEYLILANIRIPRIILGFAVGGALSISGVVLQGVYRNPLVEPYTLGISGGAALGVAITIVFGLHHILGVYTLPISGIAGAVVTIFIVYFLSLRKMYLNINRMLLIGVMISFMASSAIMFLLATTTTENLQTIIFWTMGSLDEPNELLIYGTFYTSIVGLIVFYFFSWNLNALRLGENSAKHLGVNTSRTIKILFVLASILTGVSVATVGVIGFVGLIIPHLLRSIVGSDFRILLLSSFLGGSIFIIISDVIARTIISPNELPIGVITGIIGGLMFIVVLSKRLKI